MLTPQFYVEYRRRLPKAPNVDSVFVETGMSTALTQTQTMDATPKKRLTPEVVATLLLIDSEPGGEKSYSQRNTMLHDMSSDPVHRIVPSDNEYSHRLKFDVTPPPDNIGIVEIIKKSGKPLGFSVREYDGMESDKVGGIIVSRLTTSGVVHQHSLLRIGDEILEINKVPVQGYKLSDVVAMIQIPKRLVMKVRFVQPHQSKRDSLIYEYNNNDSGKMASHPDNGDKQNTCIAQRKSDLSENKLGSPGCTEIFPPPDLLMVRRNSGRLLPDPPELVKKTLYLNSGEDNQIVSSKTKPQPGRHLSMPELHQGNDQYNAKCVGHENIESRAMNIRIQNSRKKSVELPVPTEPKQGNEQLNRDDNHTYTTRDPKEIRFELMTSNGSTTELPCQILKDSKLENKKNIASPLSLKKNVHLNAFGSSSSLSSSDSPDHKRQNPVGGNIDIVADSSPLSKTFPGDGNLQAKQTPLFQHSLSSEDLRNSNNNSWFSKINRKNIRKLSEGPLLQSQKGTGEPYRVQELRNLSNDNVDGGYMLYSGGNRYGRSQSKVTCRAVTGMVALNIVKASRISLPSDTTLKEKRKKTKVFCSVDTDGVRQACTCVKKGFDNFQWNESFEIELQRNKEVKIIVWVRSKKDGDRAIAEGTITIAQLLNGGCSEHLLALCLEPHGTLYIKLQFTDMKVLLQRTPSQKNEGVFGVPMETVLRRENGKIPIIVKKCVEEINDRGVEVTGIYRLCGNAAKKKVLRAQFENNSGNVDLRRPDNPADVNVITGLLKDYLRELPQPLLCQDVREILYKASEVEERSELNDQLLVNEVTTKFSRILKETIVYLLDHFATVLLNSDSNKMDSHNLAVCIGPVLSCPSLGSSLPSSVVSDTKKDINAIKILLEIWPKPEQVSAC